MKLLRFYAVAAFVLCTYVAWSNYTGYMPLGGTAAEKWGPEGKKNTGASRGGGSYGRWGGGYHK
jgi:hypothetical protein